MKSFFEEYGFIILTCVVVIALVGIAVGIKPLMASSISNITSSWGSEAKESLNDAWTKKKVASVGENEYTTFNEATKAAVNGSTIVLSDDISTTLTLPDADSAYTITIDANGHKLNLNNKKYVNSSGNAISGVHIIFINNTETYVGAGSEKYARDIQLTVKNDGSYTVADYYADSGK